MKNWSTGNPSEFAIDVSDIETDTGYFNATVTFWISGVRFQVGESLASLRSLLSNVVDKREARRQDPPRNWSPEQIAQHFGELRGRERSDEEDEHLFNHWVLPLFDSARDRAGFMIRTDAGERLVLAERGTARVVASADLRPGKFDEVVSSFVRWIDELVEVQRSKAE